MIHLLNPIKILVLATFLVGLFYLQSSKTKHRYLIFILLTCFLLEFTSIAFILNKIQIHNLFTIGVIIHHTLWLVLVLNNFSKKKKLLFCLGFVVFSILNLFLIEGHDDFNILTFILGSLLYILLFLYLSFANLKRENLSFFQSNDFILLFAPVLVFLGMSFIFGFKNKELNTTIIFNNIKLYTFINHFVNIVYYALINIYIFKERKLKNV